MFRNYASSALVRFATLFCLVTMPTCTIWAQRTIIEHIGDADPLTEGWTNGQTNGVDAGPFPNDMGFDAWEVITAGAFARYNYDVSPADAFAMQTTGFRATSNLRSVGEFDVPFPHDTSLANLVEVELAGIGQWTLSIGADAFGNPVLSQADVCCESSEVAIPLDPSITGNTYHEYRMDYNPNVSTTAVEVFVDSISHGMMETAPTIFGNRFNFGSSTSTAVYDTNWNLVRLETEIFPCVTDCEPPGLNRLVGRHEDANDPTTEGWGGNGTGTSPVFADMGFDAWNQTDPGAFARYDRAIPPDQAAAMLEEGWHAKANVRNLRADDSPDDLGGMFEVSLAALGQFNLFFGSDANSNPLILAADSCCLGGTPIPLDPTITGDGYHLFEMLYDPTVNATDVEIIVDGISAGFMPPAASNFGDRFNFGSSDSGALGSFNWNLVELLILGGENPLIPGDFNNSGEVDAGDLNLVLFNWDQPGSSLPSDWVNQVPSGNVGVLELNDVLFNWGSTGASATVPEPSALGSLLMGVAWLVFWKKRRIKLR